MSCHGGPSPGGNKVPLRLLNPRDVEVSVTKGTILAELESVPESSVITSLSQQAEHEDEPSEMHRRRLWRVPQQG